MGPLALSDFIGNDTVYAIAETLARETGDSKYRPSVLVSDISFTELISKEEKMFADPFKYLLIFLSWEGWSMQVGWEERLAKAFMITTKKC